MKESTQEDTAPIDSIKASFDADKKFVHSEVENYLKNTIKKPNLITRAAIDVNDISTAIQQLEELREAKTGITITKIPSEQGRTPVLIRDARKCKQPYERSTESFEIQYLNAIRAAIDLAHPDAKDLLMKQAKTFMDQEKGFAAKMKTGFSKEYKKLEELRANIDWATDSSKKKDWEEQYTKLSNKLQKKFSEAVLIEIKEVGNTLSKLGITNAMDKLNVAKDYQNFKDPHYNIVTIGSMKGFTDPEVEYTTIEAEVAMRGLTNDQKKEFENIKSDTKPKWFEVMKDYEKELLLNNVDKILANGVIPTQLTNIPGMRNAFEKITGIIDKKNQNIQVTHTSKHAGTVVCLTKDKESVDRITQQNIEQAQAFVGKSATLCLDVLNSEFGNSKDRKIVSAIRRNASKKGIMHAINSYNLARVLARQKDHQDIAEYLTKIENFNSVSTLKNEITNLKELVQQGTRSITWKPIKIGGFTLPIKTPSIDGENNNLQINTKFAALTHKINELTKDNHAIPLELKIETLIMCKSGKDRTGLSEFYQSVFANAKAAKFAACGNADLTDDELKEAIKSALATGHTATMAGSVFAGGGTLGCYGTKSENEAGLPNSLKKELMAIIEPSAKNNNISSAKGFKALISFIKKPLNSIFPAKPQFPANDKKINEYYQKTLNQIKNTLPTQSTDAKQSKTISKAIEKLKAEIRKVETKTGLNTKTFKKLVKKSDKLVAASNKLVEAMKQNSQVDGKNIVYVVQVHNKDIKKGPDKSVG